MSMNLWEIPAIDHHAHNLLKPEILPNYSYSRFFSEAHDPTLLAVHSRQTLFYRRSTRDIAQLLNCQATESAIIESRQQLGLENLTRLCFNAANLSAIFLDDGFMPQEILPWQWHQQFSQIKRVLRLEYLAETLLAKIDNFSDFLDKFREELTALPSEVIAFKSIAAYRSGLNIQITPFSAAQASFDNIKSQPVRGSFRLSDKPLIDFLFWEALKIAAQQTIPIQLHTGFGDPDLDLQLANPLLLRPLLENSQVKNAPIVLLHGSYPYMREAGYLASVYPQVFLDFGLAIPFLSQQGMRSTLQQLLELAPTSKIMYSSDAHLIPELYYLGAKWGREILGQILDDSVNHSELTAKEADDIALAILKDNARFLYDF